MNRKTLHELIAQLRFNGIAKALDNILNQAEKEAWPVESVLRPLFEEELQHRKEQSMIYRIAQAKLPWDWTMESFPFKQQPGVNATQMRSLASLDFVQRTENLVFIGPPGTGKTGLGISILRKALVNGYRGRFYNAQDLIDELYASLADRSTPKLINRLCNYDVLLIDELGYLTLKPEQVNALFKLFEQRYGKKSTIITTNLDYPEWYDLFQRKPLVDALLDRLQHYCITIRIDGPSLRQPDPGTPTKRKTKTRPK